MCMPVNQLLSFYGIIVYSYFSIILFTDTSARILVGKFKVYIFYSSYYHFLLLTFT